MWTQNESTQAFLGVRLQAFSIKKSRFKKNLTLKKHSLKKIYFLAQHSQVKVYKAETNQSPPVVIEMFPLISVGVDSMF